MGRGLSPQQRAVLALAYDGYRRRDERAQERADLLVQLEAAGGRPADAPRPSRPSPDLWYDHALLALHGFKHGEGARDRWRRRLPTDTIRLYRGATRYGEAAGTISRAEYDAAHASLARTLARLVARGYLVKLFRGGYSLTDAGVDVARQLAATGDQQP